MEQENVIIIGSGIAALQLAKNLRHDLNVIIITKSKLLSGNSNMAQGGIAAAIDALDSPKNHYEDTLEAGRYHNNAAVVEAITAAGPFLIRELMAQGCAFDHNSNGMLKLGLEGAHSKNRIVHSGGDATGKQVMNFLSYSLQKNIVLKENRLAYELLIDHQANRCYGVKVKRTDGGIETYMANHIVLATGGCGQLYSYTSNAASVCGDGIALAYQAGARLADMEFMQFHPTLLYINGRARGLVSEAVRGEGGKLVTENGFKIMEGVHPLKDLAPRHVVSQTIYSYLQQKQPIYLDISGVTRFAFRFPTIAQLCKDNGVALKSKRIPVVPGSHFLMGGVCTDLYGRTNIKGLYAIGEVARTGVHGANRLASNSLLEGLFFGKQLAGYLNKQDACTAMMPPATTEIELYEDNVKLKLPTTCEIQKTMMDRVGIVREEADLLRQKEWLSNYNTEWSLSQLSIEQIQTIFMIITSKLITSAALIRTESRGGHYRTDYPAETKSWLAKTVIQTKKKDDIHEQTEIAVAT